MKNRGGRFRTNLILITLAILSSILIYSCTIGGDDTDDDDAGNGSECDIECYKGSVADFADCINKGFDCQEQGGDIFECNEEAWACFETVEDEMCGCADKCDSILKDLCSCYDTCEPYPEGGECKWKCWEDKLCKNDKWLDCDCWQSCGEKYKECVADIEPPYDEQDYQIAHQCVDELETCWLSCLNE